MAGIFAVGALSCSVAPNAWTLSLCRIVLGFAVGGATQTVPRYVAELAPPARRGRLVLTFQVGIGVGIGVGIVVSTIVGATETLSWRVSVGLAVIPATLLLLLMLRLPESYLVMMIVGLSIVDRVGRRRLTMVIYPLAVRGVGTSAQAATLWSTNLLITLTLLTIIDTVGVGPTMWLYAAFNVAAVLFVWRRMPELTGRSLEQIESRLRQGHFRRPTSRPPGRSSASWME